MLNKQLNELIEWYWDFGSKRGGGNNVQYRISTGDWLDPVMQIVERDKAIIASAKNTKACLALWGPSQSGKSMMLSQYVDGINKDGTDSALTWDDAHPVIFRRDKNDKSSVAAGTVIFNPYNHGSDASGLPTRYTLKGEDDGVNRDFPIEVKFTTRPQIMQSLARGYLEVGLMRSMPRRYDMESFRETLARHEQACTGQSNTMSRESYQILKDTADVIECMKMKDRFKFMFDNINHWKEIRKEFVSSRPLLSNKEQAKKFMTEILWDSCPNLTMFYEEAEKLRAKIQKKWDGYKILAEMEVGALLLDIDSFEYLFTSNNNEDEEFFRNRVCNLSFSVDDIKKEVHLFIDKSGLPSAEDGEESDDKIVIRGKKFGIFQAICAELIVPLREQNIPLLDGSEFTALMEKNDILDFPGVSDYVDANNQKTKVDCFDEKDRTQGYLKVCKEVFKRGKTQCFVHSYIQSYGIDAFAILCAIAKLGIRQPSLLNEGINGWMDSFPDSVEPMPVFINLTFFADVIESIKINNKGLETFSERIRVLDFLERAKPSFFATTYSVAPIPAGTNQEKTVNDILGNVSLRNMLGEGGYEQDRGNRSADLEKGKEVLNALWGKNNGQGYMLEKIAGKLDIRNRMDRGKRILKNDIETLLNLMSKHMPDKNAKNVAEIQRVLNDCADQIDIATAPMSRAEDFRDLSDVVNRPFDVSPDEFELIPLEAKKTDINEIDDYVQRQIPKWYEKRIDNIKEYGNLKSEHLNAVVKALRQTLVDKREDLATMITDQLGNIHDNRVADAARYPFSFAFSNILRCGKIYAEEKDSKDPSQTLQDYIDAEFIRTTHNPQRKKSPYLDWIINPIRDRIRELAREYNAGR